MRAELPGSRMQGKGSSVVRNLITRGRRNRASSVKLNLAEKSGCSASSTPRTVPWRHRPVKTTTARVRAGVRVTVGEVGAERFRLSTCRNALLASIDARRHEHAEMSEQKNDERARPSQAGEIEHWQIERARQD